MKILPVLANETPISRSDALHQGLRYYFTGVPCRRGHTTRRYVSTGSCIGCMQDLHKTEAKVNAAARRLRASGGYMLVLEGSSEVVTPASFKALVEFAQALGFTTRNKITFPYSTPSIAAPAPPSTLHGVPRGTATPAVPSLREIEQMTPEQLRAYCEANNLKMPS